ncbi:MAG TPA: cation diffusion facilitator family transporter [Rudaea sp.]|jgi:cobalt-zinc-cadmium efflux system protein|nr:cation diffusion facilitator family transporter [Rudaea sp.]
MAHAHHHEPHEHSDAHAHSGHDHANHDHARGHQHDYSRAPERALRLVLALTAALTLAEAIGGWWAQSLALISDAAHMLTDTAALAIALVAVHLGKRSADAKRTFGYARFEILAAALNAAVLILVAIYIFVAAVGRLRQPESIQTSVMMVLAAIGLVVNLVAMRLLHASSDHSLNMKGAYLEVWSDMLASFGVLVAGAVIACTGWTRVDPIVAVAISLWVLPRTWLLLKASVNILLEGAPPGVDVAAIESVLRDMPGVAGVHDLHVWSVSSGQVLLTAHIERDVAAIESDSETLIAVRGLIAQRFGISHATLQLEHVVCDAGCVLAEPMRHGHSA